MLNGRARWQTLEDGSLQRGWPLFVRTSGTECRQYGFNGVEVANHQEVLQQREHGLDERFATLRFLFDREQIHHQGNVELTQLGRGHAAHPCLDLLGGVLLELLDLYGLRPRVRELVRIGLRHVGLVVVLLQQLLSDVAPMPFEIRILPCGLVRLLLRE